jgi:hypothetical protein
MSEPRVSTELSLETSRAAFPIICVRGVSVWDEMESETDVQQRRARE